MAPGDFRAMLCAMRFAGVTEKLNAFFFRAQLRRLTRLDMEMADRWTLARIREGHPDWSEERVMLHFEALGHLPVRAVDEWSRRFGLD